MNNMEAAEVLRNTTLFGEQQKRAKAMAVAALEQHEQVMKMVEHLGSQIPEWRTPENKVPDTSDPVLVQAVMEDLGMRALFIGCWDEYGWVLETKHSAEKFRVEAWMPLPTMFEMERSEE